MMQYISNLKMMKSVQFKRLAIGITVLFVLVYPLHFLARNPLESMVDFQYVDPYSDASRLYTSIHKSETNSSVVMFPKNLSFDEDTVRDTFNITEEDTVMQYSGNSSSLTTKQLGESTTRHSIEVFNSVPNAESCEDLKQDVDLMVSDNKIMRQDFEIMIERLQYQLENEEAFAGLTGFFKDKIPLYLKWKVYHLHFYQFAGTSVWLEEYGVHLMISRVIHSLKGKKGDPQVSLLYAQIYNSDWEELTDVELIIPMTQPNGKTTNDEKLKFPRFLPIPFYHNSEFTKERWYGPEDARMLLIENEKGQQEPAIIYNSYQRQISNQTTTLKDNTVVLNFDFYRSMFIAWPFRYQLGKANTDGFVNPEYDDVKFNKVAELKIADQPRNIVEKNWTPMFVEQGYIHMVYEWADLKVLKCNIKNLTTEDGLINYSNCVVAHHDEAQEFSDAFSPIRGGTELIPIKHDTRKLWLGFLRAHIDDCGCGKAMYRPNLVILEKHKNQFKVLHLSSYMSLDIPVPGWKTPEIQCAKKDPSALIPNGISSWAYSDNNDQDVLTMSLSVADEHNVLVNIHGLRKVVDELLNGDEVDWDNKVSSDQMKCVIKYSSDFCKAYGEEQESLGLTDSLFSIRR
ncbi:BMT6 Beta-mannosyltransferase 6 [Candida maltosa Xu316]